MAVGLVTDEQRAAKIAEARGRERESPRAFQRATSGVAADAAQEIAVQVELAESPRSYPYLRLLFEYRLGTPAKRVEAGSKGGLQIIFSHPPGYDPLAEKSAAMRQARAVPMPSSTPEYDALAEELVEDLPEDHGLR